MICTVTRHAESSVDEENGKTWQRPTLAIPDELSGVPCRRDKVTQHTKIWTPKYYLSTDSFWWGGDKTPHHTTLATCVQSSSKVPDRHGVDTNFPQLAAMYGYSQTVRIAKEEACWLLPVGGLSEDFLAGGSRVRLLLGCRLKSSMLPTSGLTRVTKVRMLIYQSLVLVLQKTKTGWNAVLIYH